MLFTVHFVCQGPCPTQPAVRAGQGSHPGRDPPGSPGDRHTVWCPPGPDSVRRPQGGQTQAGDAGRVSEYFSKYIQFMLDHFIHHNGSM